MVDLYERAEQFEHNVETYLRDSSGVILFIINIDTMKQFERGFFDETKDIFRYPGADRDYEDFSEYLDYENVGMVTGAYLCAQIWKYRALKDPAALERARQCFVGLKTLFDMCQQVEEGFFCKPYGWKITKQISSDQYLFAMAGLDAFMPFASYKERQECAEMMDKMVRFWMRKGYSYPYFGKPLDWPLERFTVFAWLAFHHTGKSVFLDEFNRLAGLDIVKRSIPFTSDPKKDLEELKKREPKYEIEKKTGNRVWWPGDLHTGHAFLSLEALLKYNAPNRALWLETIRKLYEFGAPRIGDDGLVMGPQRYDFETQEMTEIRQVIDYGESFPAWRLLALIGWIKIAMGATMFARAAVAIHAYHPSLGALGLARHILENIDHDQLRFKIDVDGKQLPPEMKWAGRTYCADSAVNWLWAYWQARATYGEHWSQEA